jgi:tripartite-type tricarboxylate transporter receptor subunit TctC
MGMRRREFLGVLGGAAVGPVAASAQQTMLVGLSLLSLINSAAAQTWPTRAIKLIVSTGPGLATDIMARLLSDRLSRALGQQIFVENIPGAAGMIGAQAAVRSPPDGYTFYLHRPPPSRRICFSINRFPTIRSTTLRRSL